MAVHINLNEQVKVKLTDYGKEQYEKWFKKNVPGFKFEELATDNRGYVTLSIWELMNMFGEVTFNGSPDVCFEKNEFIIGSNV